jgi:hypothetical protein
MQLLSVDKKYNIEEFWNHDQDSVTSYKKKGSKLKWVFSIFSAHTLFLIYICYCFVEIITPVLWLFVFILCSVSFIVCCVSFDRGVILCDVSYLLCLIVNHCHRVKTNLQLINITLHLETILFMLILKRCIVYDITLCSILKVNQCFGGKYYLQVHRRRISQGRNQRDAVGKQRKMEAKYSSPNASWLSTDCMTLYPRRQNSS